MPRKRPVVQIGPISNDPAESVSAVNKSLMHTLQFDYDFVPAFAERKYGNTQQSRFNLINSLYFLKHLGHWVFHCAATRPDLAHYAVTSGWAMEKSIAFLGMARAFGAKTVGHLHSGCFIDHWEAMPAWRKKWARRQLRKLDALIVLSNWWREAVVQHIGLPAEKVFVVNNPIEPQFERDVLQVPIERADTVILSLGVMGKDKGIMEILNAVRAMRTAVPFQIELAGPEREPNIHNTVKEFIACNSLTSVINMQSTVWGPRKSDLFKRASIFLLPSYYENFPLVVLEAAAAGHAIVTTPVGAIPEFFKDGASAIFVEPGNSEQISRALVRLIENPTERAQLGRAAREVFTSRLARKTIARSLDAIYQSTLRERLVKDSDAGLSSESNASGWHVALGRELPKASDPDEDGPPATIFFSSQFDRFARLYQEKACFKDRLNLFVNAVERAFPAPARVLDFGCGPGVISMALGSRGYKVLGVDGARGMVEMAQSKAEDTRLANVRFEQAGALEFQGHHGEFDAVVCSSVIEYVEDDLGLLKKLINALRPGGRLFVSVPHTGSAFAKVEDAMRLSARFLRRESSRHLVYTLRRYQRKHLLAELNALGLEVYKCTNFEFPVFGNFGIRLSRSAKIGKMLLIEARKRDVHHASEPARLVEASGEAATLSPKRLDGEPIASRPGQAQNQKQTT